MNYKLELVEWPIDHRRRGWKGLVSLDGKRVYETETQARRQDAKILGWVWISQH